MEHASMHPSICLASSAELICIAGALTIIRSTAASPCTTYILSSLTMLAGADPEEPRR